MLKRYLSGVMAISMLFLGMPDGAWSAPVLMRGEEKAGVIPAGKPGGQVNPAAAQVKHMGAVEAAVENNLMPQAPAPQPAAHRASPAPAPPKGMSPGAAAVQPQSESAPAKINGGNAAPLNQAKNNVTGQNNLSQQAQAILDWIKKNFPNPKFGGNQATAGLQGLINLVNALPPGMVTIAPTSNGGLTITIGGVITITLTQKGLGVVVTVGIFGLGILQINGTMFGTTIQVIPGSGIIINNPSAAGKPTTVTVPWPNGPPITFTF